MFGSTPGPWQPSSLNTMHATRRDAWGETKLKPSLRLAPQHRHVERPKGGKVTPGSLSDRVKVATDESSIKKQTVIRLHTSRACIPVGAFRAEMIPPADDYDLSTRQRKHTGRTKPSTSTKASAQTLTRLRLVARHNHDDEPRYLPRTDIKGIVLIPAHIQEIKTGAFEMCTEITKVVFAEPSKLRKLGVSTFKGCRSLLSIVSRAGRVSWTLCLCIGCA